MTPHADYEVETPDMALIDALGWRVGDRLFGRYEVLAIKSGGMGSVVICRARGSGQRLALKIPHMTLGTLWDPKRSGSDLIANELTAWRRLSIHPNVLRLLDIRQYKLLESWALVGSADSVAVPALVVAYGGPHHLGEYLTAHAGLSREDKVHLLRQVALGMQHTHACGVSPHMDLKPQNVLVDEHGMARVTDFGLARIARPEQSRSGQQPDMWTTQFAGTSPGVVCGAPAYMAPEQWRGANLCDHRTDIYAFGVLAFEVVTGRHPYGDQLGLFIRDVCRAHERAEPELALLNRWPRLRDTIARCLRKHPGERFQSWDEVLAALPSLPPVGGSEAAPSSAEHDHMLLKSALLLGSMDDLASIVDQADAELRAVPEFPEAHIRVVLDRKTTWRAFRTMIGYWIRGRGLPWALVGRTFRQFDDAEGLIRVASSCLFTGTMLLLITFAYPRIYDVLYDYFKWSDFSAAVFSLVAILLGCILALLALAVSAVVSARHLIARRRCPNCGNRLVVTAGNFLAGGGPLVHPRALCPQCGFHAADWGGGKPRFRNGVPPVYDFMGVLCWWNWPHPARKRVRFGVAPFQPEDEDRRSEDTSNAKHAAST